MRLTARTRAESRRIACIPVLALGLVLGGCQSDRPVETAGDGSVETATDAPDLFPEITSEVGLSGDAEGWPDGRFSSPEIMAPGVALLDYDDDGDLDILQVRFPRPDRPNSPAPNRLYRQEADGRFVDVTESSGLGDPGYGLGAAVGDVDNDGDVDVYMENLGGDALYLNQGDGTFTDATAEAGISGQWWTASASFCDYDRDGDLDLFVVHYLDYSDVGGCLAPDGTRDYCGPQDFEGLPDKLYRNDGDASFTDVTREAGIVLPDGGTTAKGLGVLCADLTGDGWVDFYVANDRELNQLWVNRKDGTFSDEGIMRGVAVNRQGKPEASMGLTIGDIDRDGSLDIYMTHLAQENNRLYTGGRLFNDRSMESRLSSFDFATTGFGCGFFDYDNDGDLDLAVVNGRVYRAPPLPGAGLSEFWNVYAEPNFLFENDGTGVFEDVSARAPDFGGKIEISRGLAFGDIDNDGDVDLVLANGDTSIRVFRNDAAPSAHHWLRVRALTGRRYAVGATLRVAAGDETQVAIVQPVYSYQSSCDPRVHIGLGTRDRVDHIEVLWPDGQRERFRITGVDREVTLRQGTGEAT